MAMTLKEKVAKNTIKQGDCLLWGGSITKWGRPVTYLTEADGTVKQVDLQLFLARKKFNLLDNTKVKITTTCGNKNCIAKQHIEIHKVVKNTAGRKKRGTKCSDIALNMQVFTLAVNYTVPQIIMRTGVSRTTVLAILGNEAMLPYFQLRLQWHLGETVLSRVKVSNLSDEELKAKYFISQYAVDFIRSEQRFAIADEDLFVAVLRNCRVLGEHLVWDGEFYNGVALFRTIGGSRKSAFKSFKCAITGRYPAEVPRCLCGEVDCINPFHLE